MAIVPYFSDFAGTPTAASSIGVSDWVSQSTNHDLSYIHTQLNIVLDKDYSKEGTEEEPQLKPGHRDELLQVAPTLRVLLLKLTSSLQ